MDTIPVYVWDRVPMLPYVVRATASKKFDFILQNVFQGIR